MKRITVIGFIFAGMLFAQPTKVWERIYGENDNSVAPLWTSVTCDNQGNIYLLLDEPLRIVKYTEDGDEVWAKELKTGNYESGKDIFYYDGYIYVSGYTKDTTQTSSNNDMRVVKYDLDGNIVWKKSYDLGYDSEEYGFGIYVKNGYIYVTGQLHISVDDSRLILFKLSASNGDEVWVDKFHPIDSYCWGEDVIVDDEGNIFITGTYMDANNSADLLVLKYSNDGDRDWVSYTDVSEDDKGTGITLLNNFLYISGYTKTKAIIVKYDKNGNEQDGKLYLGEDDWFSSIASENGALCVIGAKSNSSDYDIYLAKLDENINVIWQKIYDGGMNDEGEKIVVKGNEIYVSGVSEINYLNYKPILIKYKEDLGIKEKEEFTVLNIVHNKGSYFIEYNVKNLKDVRLSIYDINGRRLTDLSSSIKSHTGIVNWNGTDVNGNRVPAGVYFVELKDGNKILRGKAFIVR